MEKNKKNQPPDPNDRGYGDRSRNQANPKTNSDSQKPSDTEDDNAKMRFEDDYEGSNTQNSRREEPNRKAGGNQSSNSNQVINQNSNQNYKPNSPDSNEGLNQGSKQSKEQITNKGIIQDTESINK